MLELGGRGDEINMNEKRGGEHGKCVKRHATKRESRLNRTLETIFKTEG